MKKMKKRMVLTKCNKDISKYKKETLKQLEDELKRYKNKEIRIFNDN